VYKEVLRFPQLLVIIVGLAFASQASAVTVPVASSDSSSWARSNGGTGTSMPLGGPGVWNSRYTATIPSGATNISFTLDSFSVDDKGVVQLNGSNIGDAVIFGSNGSAAGPGIFDFGSGAGSYTFVGFTPGAEISLPDGTANFELTAFVNDTGTSNPSAPAFAIVGVASSFNLSGTLSYDVAGAAPVPGAVTPIPTLPQWGLILLAVLVALSGMGVMRFRRAG
jgi:hypothetical protein